MCSASPVLYVICYIFSITPAFIFPTESIFVNGLIIKDMRNQDPFYFKQISTANTICNTYSVDLNLDIQNYFSNNALILTGISNLESACKIIEKENMCKNIITPLHAQYDLIYEHANTIESFHSKLTKRQTDNRLHNNSTNDIISNFLSITSESIARVNDEINHITNEIQSLQDIHYDVKLTDLHNRLNLMTQSIAINIDKQFKLSTAIFEILADINANKIFELFTPSTFHNILNKIQILANKEKCEIPVYPFKHHLSSVLKTAKITTKLALDTLNIKIDFPTAKKEEFSLYEIISLPFSSNKITYIIKPAFPYLLLREKTNSEYEIQYLTREEKNSCIDMPTNVYFCYPTQPIYTVKEVFLNVNDVNFFKKHILPCDFNAIRLDRNPGCIFEKTFNENAAINIDYGKYFIYVVKPFTAELICPKNKTEIIFSYTQICHIPFECNLLSKSIVIFTHKSNNVDLNKDFLEKNIILNRINNDFNTFNDTFILPKRARKNNNNEQHDNANSLKERIMNIFSTNQKSQFKLSNALTIFIYTLLILIPFLLCLILCYYIYKIKQSIQDIKENSIYNHIVRTIETDENGDYEKPFNLVFHYDVPKSAITPVATFESFYEERKKRFSNICLEPAPLLPERKYKNVHYKKPKRLSTVIEEINIESDKDNPSIDIPVTVVETPKIDLCEEKAIVPSSNQNEKEESIYVSMSFNRDKKQVTWDLQEPNTSNV